MMEKGSEGHTLHGSSGPGFDPHQYYVFKGGNMHTGLTVVAWQFADVNPGDGGRAFSYRGEVPQSHNLSHTLPTADTLTGSAVSPWDVRSCSYSWLPQRQLHLVRLPALFSYSRSCAYTTKLIPRV